MSLHSPRPTKECSQLDKLAIPPIFSGIYRMCKTKAGGEINGIHYTTIELHNASGIQVGLCGTEAINWYQNKPYQLVHARGYALNGADEHLAHIVEIKPATGIIGINAILSLPRILCKEPSDLDKLVNLRHTIQSPALGQFVDTLFADDDIVIPFLQVPASSKYHHHDVGGLLAHSIEVAEITANQAYESKDEREIAMVTALFHDIGKVRTLGANLATTNLGKMVGHDHLTLEICAAALKELDKTWPEASYTMRHVWTCATPGAKYGFERNCTIANIVQFADKLSVDRYDQNETFKTSNKSHGLAWDSKKFYWRPAAEPTSNERNHLCLLTSTR